MRDVKAAPPEQEPTPLSILLSHVLDTVRWWHPQAACRDADTDLFFSESRETEEVVKEGYCAECVVRDECLDDALSIPVNQDYGVRGGMTRLERRRFRKELTQ